MNRQLAIMEDPTFDPGSTHPATIHITVKPAGISCTAELWLTVDGKIEAASGTADFTSTGAEQSINVSVKMPSTSPTNGYAVYLDIVSGGVLIRKYEASERVWIALSNVGVTGIVKASDTGLPLSGATVNIADLSAVTEFNGRFTITGWSIVFAHVVASYPGYGDKQVDVEGLTSNMTKDIGIITLDPIAQSVMTMASLPTIDKTSVYVGGWVASVGIYFNFKNTGTGTGNGNATYGVDVVQPDGSVVDEWTGPCPSLNPGQSQMVQASGVSLSQVGANQIRMYFNDQLVRTLSVTVKQAYLTMTWAQKPPAFLSAGNPLTGTVSISNPTDARVILQLTVIVYLPDGSRVTVLTVGDLHNTDQVIGPGEIKSYSVRYAQTQQVGFYLMDVKLDWTWDGSELLESGTTVHG